MPALRSCPHPVGPEAASVITIRRVSETTSPSHFLPADFRGNRRRLVCYQGGSPGLSERGSRGTDENGALCSACARRGRCQMRSPCRRARTEGREEEDGRGRQEVQRSAAPRSVSSRSGNVDFSFVLAHRLKWIRCFPSHRSLIPFSHHKNPSLSDTVQPSLWDGLMVQATHRFRGRLGHQG